jgi:DNA-binding transcriptional regulator YdaS (Cro superfamily)
MTHPTATLADAIEKAGSQAALAREIGVTQQAISERIKADKLVPAEWCVAIERATGIPRQSLRPDLYEGMAAFPPAPRSVTPSDMDAARYEEAMLSAAPEALP